ncbi:MAG: Crp/Fnr family transcriptional regulator [Candidatus Marinimicrobia bacterium]|nr:Crp/Fnr family transcriptional regulator [Candidatus Neomarinimicrobiota bacterium]
MSKIDLLRTVPIFSELNDNILIKISELMQVRSYAKEQMILMEEALGDSFFVISSGSVKITRLSEDGREVILAMLGEGEFFGEMSLLDGETRSANVIAIEDAEVMVLNRGEFLGLLERYPKIAISLLEELTRRLRKSDQQIESLSLSDAEKRIAITLIRLAEELGVIKLGAVTIRNLPYQQDIANMAGTSRETVSRTLKLLEEKGYIERTGKILIVHKFDQFRRVFT